MLTPPRTSLFSSNKSWTFSAAATPTSLKGTVATSASPVTYTTGGSTLTLVTNELPRLVTATSASHAASYVDASVITITGTAFDDSAQTDTLTVAGTGGGATLTSTKYFKTVTSIAVAAQADTGGAWTFGLSDTLCVLGRQIRAGTAGNLTMKFEDGTSDTVAGMVAGERLDIGPRSILGTSTLTSITVLF